MDSGKHDFTNQNPLHVTDCLFREGVGHVSAGLAIWAAEIISRLIWSSARSLQGNADRWTDTLDGGSDQPLQLGRVYFDLKVQAARGASAAQEAATLGGECRSEPHHIVRVV